MICVQNERGRSLRPTKIGDNGTQSAHLKPIYLNMMVLNVNNMYEPDITDFIGDSMVEEMLDDTEPTGVAFDPGNPIRDYQNEAVKELNSR